jgi:hypothetical protein
MGTFWAVRTWKGYHFPPCHNSKRVSFWKPFTHMGTHFDTKWPPGGPSIHIHPYTPPLPGTRSRSFLEDPGLGFKVCVYCLVFTRYYYFIDFFDSLTLHFLDPGTRLMSFVLCIRCVSKCIYMTLNHIRRATLSFGQLLFYIVIGYDFCTKHYIYVHVIYL